MGFSHSSFLPHGSMLVKLTDNRFTCLTNPVKNKHSLTPPVNMTFRDDSHYYLGCFLYIVRIRFNLSNHLFLFSHLLRKFRIVRSLCVLWACHTLSSMVYNNASLLENVSVPLTHKLEFQRSIFEFIFSSAFSIPCLP